MKGYNITFPSYRNVKRLFGKNHTNTDKKQRFRSGFSRVTRICLEMLLWRVSVIIGEEC